jgi:hypothetical protein
MHYVIGAKERSQQSCGVKDEEYVAKLPEKEVWQFSSFWLFSL